MKIEPVIVFVIIVGGFLFFCGLLPLLTVLFSLGRVWQASRPAGLVLIGVVLSTSVVFLLLLASFFGIVVTGRQP